MHRHLDDSQAVLAGPADHLQLPAGAAVPDAEAEQGVAADGPEGAQVGQGNAVQHPAHQPERPVGGHGQRRHRPGLPDASQARPHHKVGLAVQDRPGHLGEVGAVEGAVGVGEGDHFGVRRRLHAGPAGGAEAPSWLGDDPGSAGRGHRRGAVAGAVVDHQQVDAGGERGEGGRQRRGLVQGREHDGDARQVHAAQSRAGP